MNIALIISIILQILEQLKKSESEGEFVAACTAVEGFGSGGFTANGQFLKFIWENREEILKFVLQIVDLFSDTEPS